MSILIVEEDVKLRCNELKLGRAHRFIVFTVIDFESKIKVDYVASLDKSFNDLIAYLPKNECRWIIYSFDEMGKNSIVLFSWTPDSAKVKEKMLFFSNKDLLKRNFTGKLKEFNFSEISEFNYDEILAKL